MGGEGEDGIEKHPEHKLNERSTVGLPRVFLQSLIVLGLMLIYEAFQMTCFTSRMAVICASLSVFPSIASEPRMVRMRLMRRRRSDFVCSLWMLNRPTASLI